MKVGIQNKEAAAQKKKAEIEQDWITGHYDRTRLKYMPRTLGKSATEISVPELFVGEAYRR
jgi:integrase